MSNTPSFRSVPTTILTYLWSTKSTLEVNRTSQTKHFNKMPPPPPFFCLFCVLTPWIREISLQNPHEERDSAGEHHTFQVSSQNSSAQYSWEI